ncbi:MAG: hypothetical protein ACK5R4_07070 [Alphaproteobacteria bacterium]
MAKHKESAAKDGEKSYPSPDSTAEFETKHAEDLSIKRFAWVTGIQIFLPIVAGAAAAAVGWFTLGKPIRALRPKFFDGFGHAEDVARHASKITKENLINAGAKISEVAAETLARIRQTDPQFNIENASSLKRFLKEAKIEEALAVKKALGIPTENLNRAAKMFGAAGLGWLGLTGGGIAVGYQEWRKQESQRLAAEEINRDISRIELFKPSDSELVEENKRLRQMLAKNPPTTVSQVQHEGLAKEPIEQQIA